MELGKHVKEHRARLGMSQEQLAEAIFVSRQTISNWETNRTYPDVQSLLLLSNLFEVSVDELIKGDVEEMNKTIERDVVIIRRLGLAMVALLLLSLAAVVWLAVQCTVWGWGLGQAMSTLLLALVLWGGAMFAAVWAERIKRDHDLVTFGEVLAFWEGREPDRDTEWGRRERCLPSWMRTVRTGGMILLAAAVGFLCSRYGIPLLQGLFG